LSPAILISLVPIFVGRSSSFVLKSDIATGPPVGELHQVCDCFQVDPTQLLYEMFAAQPIAESIDCPFV
jgi:1-acyl-sn-glycerol-3-phosphate acyltransferase